MACGTRAVDVPPTSIEAEFRREADYDIGRWSGRGINVGVVGDGSESGDVFWHTTRRWRLRWRADSVGVVTT